MRLARAVLDDPVIDPPRPGPVAAGPADDAARRVLHDTIGRNQVGGGGVALPFDLGQRRSLDGRVRQVCVAIAGHGGRGDGQGALSSIGIPGGVNETRLTLGVRGEVRMSRRPAPRRLARLHPAGFGNCGHRNPDLRRLGGLRQGDLGDQFEAPPGIRRGREGYSAASRERRDRQAGDAELDEVSPVHLDLAAWERSVPRPERLESQACRYRCLAEKWRD